MGGEERLGTPTRIWPAQTNCGSLGRGAISTPLTRRSLVGSGLVAMGTAALVGVPLARAAATVGVWGLDPDGDRDGCGCSACAACRAHASNKIFASAADADAGRAHRHCRCLVTQLASVETHVFEALFVSGGRRSSVDRRWQWVRAALASAAPVPAPAEPAPEAVMEPEPTSGGDRALQRGAAVATLRSAWIRRLAPGQRVVFVQLEANHAVEAELTLLRVRRSVARRHLPSVSGRQTIRIPLGVNVSPGPAELRVRFSAGDGTTRTTTRVLSVPAVRPRRR